MLTRRSILFGLLAAPAIIRTPGLLMPVKAIDPAASMRDLETLLPPGTYRMVATDFAQLEERILHMSFRILGTEDVVHHSMRI